MPAPLAIPPTVNAPDPVATRTARCLGRVSVVMMARAAAAPPSAARRGAAAAIPAVIFSNGSGTPITPVERTNRERDGRLSAASALRAMSAAAARPDSPVHAFATRAFITTPRRRPGRSFNTASS